MMAFLTTDIFLSKYSVNTEGDDIVGCEKTSETCMAVVRRDNFLTISETQSELLNNFHIEHRNKFQNFLCSDEDFASQNFIHRFQSLLPGKNIRMLGLKGFMLGSKSLMLGENMYKIVLKSLMLGENMHTIVLNSLMLGKNMHTIVLNSLMLGSKSLMLGENMHKIVLKSLMLGSKSLMLGENMHKIVLKSLILGENMYTIVLKSLILGENMHTIVLNSLMHGRKSLLHGIEISAIERHNNIFDNYHQ